ncbi:MAG: dihydrofolate reductase [Polynucleobacter victoriensis]
MELAIIVARAKNGVIGVNNTLPCQLPDYLKHFKNTTLGCPIIMGRNTWLSLGRPLPGRRNIVVSRNPEVRAEGAETFTSLEDAIDACSGVEKAFIIGGAQIYDEALAYVDKLIITEVDTEVDGDAFFPDIDDMMWEEVTREEHNNGQLAYAFVTYNSKL